MSPKNIVIQPFTPLSDHEYSHNPLASIPEAPALRCWVLCGLVRVEGLSPIEKERERGEPFPSNPLFQGLFSADLHMKWYLIHSHSVESPKPATAEAVAEGGLSHKAFNWPVIRLWNCVALLDK